MKKVSQTTYKTGSIGEFAAWTRRVVRDPRAAHGVPKQWLDVGDAAELSATEQVSAEATVKLLSPGNVTVLDAINRHRPATLRELAALTGRNEASLSRTLKRLVQAGIVAFNEGPRGARIPSVVATQVSLEIDLTGRSDVPAKSTRVVQFLHPGREHGFDRPGWKDWNCGDHKRKFLIAEGSWTPDPKQPPRRGRFTFWGEWEPQSEVQVLAQKPRAAHPRWLHIPRLALKGIESLRKQNCAPCASGGPQNTDPLVFGDRFRYALCQQFWQPKRSPRRPTQLAQLGEGEIILFGSRVDGGFALDTVFVVGAYAPVWPDGSLPSWESDLHRKITMDLIDIPPCGLRLYGGATWSPDKPFSFVPCLPVAGRARGFPRPVIEPKGVLSGIIKPALKQRHKISQRDSPTAATAIWDAVVEQVLAQQCALGTAVDEPTDPEVSYEAARARGETIAVGAGR